MSKVNSAVNYANSESSESDECDDVRIRPSTELLPDEYEHEDNKKGLVFMFHYDFRDGRGKKDMKLLRETFINLQYDVAENVYKMTTKVDVINTLNAIAKRDHTNKSCLIVVFLGKASKDGNILLDKKRRTSFIKPISHSRSDRLLLDKYNKLSTSEVCKLFTTDNCPTLKNKPKVFIFQTWEKLQKLQSDSRAKSVTYKSIDTNMAYDVSTEADILLIHKKIQDPKGKSTFMKQLCNKINQEGHKDDIISLVTQTEHVNENRPLIISTLTRKFYISPSEKNGFRYYCHNLLVNCDVIMGGLKDIQEKIVIMEETGKSSRNRTELKENYSDYLCKGADNSHSNSHTSGTDDITASNWNWNWIFKKF